MSTLYLLKGESRRVDEGLGSELCTMKGEKGNIMTVLLTFVSNAS
jgi:hypothetical protein